MWMAIEAIKEKSVKAPSALQALGSDKEGRVSRPWPLADESRSKFYPSPPDLLAQRFAQILCVFLAMGPLERV